MFRKALFWLFVVLVAFVFLRVGLRDKQPPAPQQAATKAPDPSAGVRGAGWQAAKRFVPTALKFPDEAEYPWETVVHSKDGDGAWIVTGDVIAKNAFGVRDRMHYEVALIEDGDDLTATRIRLDGKTILDTTKP